MGRCMWQGENNLALSTIISFILPTHTSIKGGFYNNNTSVDKGALNWYREASQTLYFWKFFHFLLNSYPFSPYIDPSVSKQKNVIILELLEKDATIITMVFSSVWPHSFIIFMILWSQVTEILRGQYNLQISLFLFSCSFKSLCIPYMGWKISSFSTRN